MSVRTGTTRPDLGRVVSALRCRVQAASTDERLPSERAMALELGVSRATVRAALLRLDAEDLITTRPQVGWLVRRPGGLPEQDHDHDDRRTA